MGSSGKGRASDNRGQHVDRGKNAYHLEKVKQRKGWTVIPFLLRVGLCALPGNVRQLSVSRLPIPEERFRIRGVVYPESLFTVSQGREILISPSALIVARDTSRSFIRTIQYTNESRLELIIR